jgi:DNA-binding response OmpR family regulator
MSRARVLLLEDDVALRGLLQEVLGLEGFVITAFESFDDVRRAAQQQDGEIILADFWGGAQRTLNEAGRQQIRELCQLLPVILLTGRSWASDTTAEELGARALMRKPFDLDDLLATIERVLQRDT